jgi:phage terminase large subunit-like protein
MFLMLGIGLIGSVGVIFLTELSQETIWEETAGAIAGSLIVIWLLIRFDVVGAGRPHKQSQNEEEQEREAKKLEGEVEKIRKHWAKGKAGKEAAESVKLLGRSAMTAGLANDGPGGSRATDNSQVSDAGSAVRRCGSR